MIKGLVTKCQGGLYTVLLDEKIEGEEVVTVRGRGAFRHEKIVLLSGDRVVLERNQDGSYFCKSILERKNSLIRPPLANLDYIFVVIPCKKPMPSLEIVDKMIAIAEFNKIEPVIIISKSDLDKEFAKDMYQIYKNSGFDVFITSSESNEGVDDIIEYLNKITRDKNPICAFAGASGAGKSTLINALFPTLKLETGALSEKIERGKNTTRTTELFPLKELLKNENGGYLADTPGFSLLDFERFDFFTLSDLLGTFRDLNSVSEQCKYTKCSHTKEEGCAILQKIKEGKIEKTRHQSYIALYEVLKKKPSWKNKTK